MPEQPGPPSDDEHPDDTVPAERSGPPVCESVAVVLASAGRPALLADVLKDLSRQSWQDMTIVVSVPDRASLPASPLPEDVVVVHARGLAAQRNAGLAAVPGATHVFCFDDDAVVREDYLANAMAFFDAHPDVVALTGRVVADGATGAAIERDDAESLLAAALVEPRSGEWERRRELYGCNFAFRPPALGGEQFDARLPLYSWLEDHDFARRCMRHGVLARAADCVIVHRGVKSGGRMAHERLGYSQVMNPAHLHHVGSFPLWLAVEQAGRLVAKNLVRSAVGPERPWRRERLRGNLRAARDVARHRFTPERALEIAVPGGLP